MNLCGTCQQGCPTPYNTITVVLVNENPQFSVLEYLVAVIIIPINYCVKVTVVLEYIYIEYLDICELASYK